MKGHNIEQYSNSQLRAERVRLMGQKERSKLKYRFDQALAIKTDKFNTQTRETTSNEDKSSV